MAVYSKTYTTKGGKMQPRKIKAKITKCRILNDFVFNAVKALQNISRVKYYGTNVLCDVLRGVVSKKISGNKLDKIPEYGMYKELPFEKVKNIVGWMITEHFILRTKGDYPVLHSTYEGLHYSEFITEAGLEKLKKYLEQ